MFFHIYRLRFDLWKNSLAGTKDSYELGFLSLADRSFSKRKLNREKPSVQLPVYSGAMEIDEFRSLEATWVQKLIW
jgi:hypothetical protein